jgi:hypothetical protein
VCCCCCVVVVVLPLLLLVVALVLVIVLVLATVMNLFAIFAFVMGGIVQEFFTVCLLICLFVHRWHTHNYPFL